MVLNLSGFCFTCVTCLNIYDYVRIYMYLYAFKRKIAVQTIRIGENYLLQQKTKTKKIYLVRHTNIKKFTTSLKLPFHLIA